MLPCRFNTGVRNVTIPNPAHLLAIAESRNKRSDGGPNGLDNFRPYEGPVDDYDFEKQTDNFKKLSAILEKNGTKFTQVASAHYKGDLHTNHRFVAITEDGSLLWHKYVGFAAQSGQNHVYVAGMRIKVSLFLGLTEAQQRALIGNARSFIGLLFTKEELERLNEDKTLWC